jgi:nucleoid-associated protein YgaU
MTDPLQALTQMGVLPAVSFPTDSRYYGSGVLQYTTPNGQSIPYLVRRFVPQPGAPNFITMARHAVRHGDRLDLIAAKYLGDPLVFWMICDANGAIRPHDLVAQPGRVLLITAPQGVGGATGA